ncbi:hypothetical protein HBM99_13780 [Providencia heimbachae]|uniref:hypothetical protein n=1 Tax=Providencia heimbachae TaxID=333962 RepID=UPI00141976A1|nr:hypothetical protein [Providencia heimbachae]NIH21832.1 hypothetical protein [Providencia heimbachae]NIH23410.1 hypothetical protein [Providencia heimbachae]
MQGTNWVKVSERRPKLDEPVLLYSIGEIMAAVYVLSWNSIESKVQWFIYQDDSTLPINIDDSDNWMYIKDLPLPPMPEGE